MTKWRFPIRRMLLAVGFPFGLLVVVLNFASALGASESFKDIVVTLGLIGMLVAPVIVVWRASRQADRR